MFLKIGSEKNSHSVDPGGRFTKCTTSLPGQLNVTRAAYFAVALEMLGVSDTHVDNRLSIRYREYIVCIYV